MGRALAFAIVLMAAVIPTAAGQDATLSAEERAWLDDHGPIRYAPDPGYPPFEQVLDDGTVDGINVDLLNRISRNLDVQFETVIYDNWTAVLAAMQAGKVDLLGSLAQTEERDVYMDFVGPYMRVGEVFYVRTDSPFTSNDDMTDKRVAVIENYAASQWVAENYPGAIRVPVPDVRAGLEALTAGSVDAFFENVPVTGYVILREGYNNIRILDTPLYYSEANWGVPEGNAILQSIMEKGMKSISYGDQAAVFEYWSGYDLGVRPAVGNPAWIAPAAWTLGVVAIVTATWIVALRKTVRSRTSELKELNDDLERRVEERTARLEQAIQHLDSFASSVSHDLQQPLAVLRMQAKVAEMSLAKGEQPDLDALDVQVRKMTAYIETLLNFSRVHKVEHRLEAPFAPIVEDLYSLLVVGEEQPPALDVDADLSALCDPHLLRVVLLNIVGNAWKFSRGAPAAKIHIGGDGETFFVRDNGPGFDAQGKGDQIFEPFVRGGTAGEAKGMGIGLATAARIVRAHGGRIWAESTPGNGATFYWTMPRKALADPAGETAT